MIFITERCIVTLINSNDKTDLFSLCDDIRVWEYLGGISTAEWNRKNIESFTSGEVFDRWIIRDKANNTFIGYISLGTHHDGDDVELSYMLLSKHWGNGYATEVAHEIIQHLFKERNLDRIVAETQSANLGSRNVLEKLGFHKVKELTRFNAKQTLYALNNFAK